MSSRAFLLRYENILSSSDEEYSFNYSHSDVAELLSLVRNGCTMPYDTGAMGVVVVIYDFELEAMKKELRARDTLPWTDKTARALARIEGDMGDRRYVCYYVV